MTKPTRTFFAFQYWGNKNATTGSPNRNTGRCNIAGDLEIFSRKEDRDAWIERGQDGCRVALTAKAARQHCLGQTVENYEYDNNMTQDQQVQPVYF